MNYYVVINIIDYFYCKTINIFIHSHNQNVMENNHNKLTSASGFPYSENENSMSIGPRGPILLQDFILHEKMAHFNRERIPERVVHAK